MSAALAASSPAALAAQAPAPASMNVDRVANAAPLEGAITIDGKLDEAAWARATPITQFTQTQPTEGAPASQRTSIRILYDADAIYIGARMYDALGAAGVRRRLARRDQLLTVQGNNGTGAPSVTSDLLVIHLDTYHDRLGEAVFLINPSNVKGDALSIGGSNLDPTWDPVWQGAARVDSLGWTAELRIPLSQLRFARGAQQTWGLQVERFIDRLNEWDEWAFWKHNEAGGPAKYGSLEGMLIAHHPRTLEVLPYVVAGGTFAAASADDPFHSSSEASTRVGADLKYLLTSNLTLDGTINPDFGQVEADPAVVNLSAYETFFPEQRPFFIAGAGAFDFGSFSCNFCSNTSNLDLFYSRRIGRPPQLGDYISASSTYADIPTATTILGAAKITGRTQNGYTVGMLDAVTDHEEARYQLAADAPVLHQEVEPLTNYFVGRIKRDYHGGNTVVGAILTSTARRLDDPLLRDSLRAHAEAGGLDLLQHWSQQMYSLRVQFAVSDVGGSTAAMQRTMESSTHFYQRPDRRVTGDGIFSTAFDTMATSMQGYGAYARIAKDAGNWFWELAENIRSPGFEVNDISYLDRVDYTWTNANIGHTWTVPGSWYRNLVLLGGGQQQFNYDGDRTDLQGQVFFSGELPNYWNWRSFVIHHPVVLDDRQTRGGPVVERAGYNDYDVGLTTDNRSRVVGGISTEWSTGVGELNSNLMVMPSVTVKPRPNVSVDFSPSFQHTKGTQFVTRIADPTATAFYGARYVFSQLDETTLSLDTRLNLTFTPNLTLELYAQPFAASGRFTNFEEYAAPRVLAKQVYGRDVGTISAVRGADGVVTAYNIDPDGAGPAPSFALANPDFSLESLRGNAVLRWEYRPGSTLFVVWQQSRAGSRVDGNFDLDADRVALFRDRPVNIFEIKLNYWLPL